MSLRSWALQAEKKQGWLRSVLMWMHLLKKNSSGRIRLVFNAPVYFLRLFQWHLLRVLVHPLNALRETPLLLSVRKQVCRAIPSLRQHYYEVPLPVNLQKEHRRIFANDFYVLKPLKIQRLKDHNILMTAYSGIVFKNFRILPASIHGRWAATRKKIFKEYYTQVMDAWLYACYDNSGAVVQLEKGKEYLHVHHWFNYYHWLTETLVRLWTVKKDINNYTLLLPESFQKFDFVMQSLTVMDVKSIRWIKEGSIVQVPKLTLVQNKPYNNHYDQVQMQQISAFFRNHPAAVNEKLDFGERIFITRRKAVRRKMVNEQEIENLLLENGFRIVALEEYSLMQEASIMSKAKYLIGMHGAGLTNMLFMPAGGRVLELHLELSDTNQMHSDVYWKLAASLGHSYYYQFCKPADKSQHFFEADYIIDTKVFKENLKQFIS